MYMYVSVYLHYLGGLGVERVPTDSVYLCLLLLVHVSDAAVALPVFAIGTLT